LSSVLLNDFYRSEMRDLQKRQATKELAIEAGGAMLSRWVLGFELSNLHKKFGSFSLIERVILSAEASSDRLNVLVSPRSKSVTASS